MSPIRGPLKTGSDGSMIPSIRTLPQRPRQRLFALQDLQRRLSTRARAMSAWTPRTSLSWQILSFLSIDLHQSQRWHGLRQDKLESIRFYAKFLAELDAVGAHYTQY